VDRYDSIVIGAGHNGLVCAAYLARAGRRVLVVEAADRPGGLAAAREFHPGFFASVPHSAGHFADAVIDELDLVEHGLKILPEPPPLTGLDANGRNIRVEGNTLSGAGAEEANAYLSYTQSMQRFADALAPFWLRTMPRIGMTGFRELATFAQLGLKLRRLGKDDMREFMRVASLPARDLMDENFDDELVKATLSWDGLIGSRMAPRSPNSAVLAMLYRRAGSPVDVTSLVRSLGAAAEASGATIQCGNTVDRILVDGDSSGQKARGVRLADGTEVYADCVVSGADPQTTFLRLVGAEYLEIEFTNRIGRLRCNGLVGKLHLALDGLPKFRGLERPDGRLIVAPDMDAIEFAFDDAKYGQPSTDPVMEITIPSLDDESLAPAGQHVLSAHVMFVPRRLKGGWSAAARDAIRDRAIDTLSACAPAIREQVLHAEFLTPEDLEREYRVTGGHWHHTEFAMDQLLMMRPTYGAAQYATPIPGLFVCGAGSHPGGDLVGAAGHNAAQEVLR
jgi:phytoene dehydrogenase-like protein